MTNSPSLSDLIERCRKARAALDYSLSAQDGAATRIREINAEISQAEKDRDADAAESDALSSVGVATKPSGTAARRVSKLLLELEAAERTINGGRTATSSLRAAARAARDELRAALHEATTDIRALAAEKYAEGIQRLRDAFFLIEILDERPMLSRKAIIPDLEPETHAFRSSTPSDETAAAFAEFRPAIDEYRRIASALEPLN